MPGVICYRTPSRDCVLLGHLYCSSYDREVQLFAGYDDQLSQVASSSLSQPAGYYTKLKSSRHLYSLARPRLTLLSISPEIVLLILAELPGSEILKCRNVCKTLERLVDQSIRLRYIIQSNARGLEPLGEPGSATSDLAGLLFRERSWTMFGAIPSTCHSLQNPPNPAEGVTSNHYSMYHAGKLVLCRGNHVIEHTLHPHLENYPREYEVLGLGFDDLDPVAGTQDILVYSTGR
ncbi:F-box protein [Rhizoctonia solani AG-3 Rhs1AP]|nr:F-box protein [Rhizoctonia solani AG-3 Rhs1AP]KEP51739.1 F-box protein [Rhizoctonia solani 123E]